MTAIYWFMIVLLSLSLTGGLARVVLGPTQADRLSASLLLGTTGTAILVLMSVAIDAQGLLDAALVLVLLAALAAAAFARFTDGANVSTAVDTPGSTAERHRDAA